MPDRASGFCYVNDAVLAILRLRERGLRVAYVDIDAHHGDGVQFAFYGDPNVLTISTHERGDGSFPAPASSRRWAKATARGFSVNLPLAAVHRRRRVPRRRSRRWCRRWSRAFKPDVLVLQLGIDSPPHRSADAPGADRPGLHRAP